MHPELHDVLPATARAFADGFASGLHSGVQIYVSLEGRVLVDAGWGEARPGVAITAGTLMPWLSAGKPLTAVALARLWERELLDIDAAVAQYLPEFGCEGKEDITLRHLLTHTAGLEPIDTGWPEAPWDAIVAAVCRAKLRPDWTPGERAAYEPSATWFLLGEILQRLDGRPFSTLLREDVLEPLGLRDTWNGMPREAFHRYGDRVGGLYAAERGGLRLLEWHTEAYCTRPSPGSNTRAPAHDLGRFYEMLLAGGTGEGIRIVSAETVARMARRQRTGLYDETFQHRLDFGLGFLVDSKQYGAVPYGFGRHCSPRTFGHGGAQSSMAFADPEHGLVVAWVANGRPGEPRHQRRNLAVNEAVYEDLGLQGA